MCDLLRRGELRFVKVDQESQGDAQFCELNRLLGRHVRVSEQEQPIVYVLKSCDVKFCARVELEVLH